MARLQLLCQFDHPMETNGATLLTRFNERVTLWNYYFWAVNNTKLLFALLARC